MSQRTSIFATPGEGKGVDVTGFAPKRTPAPRPAREDIDHAAEGSRFHSREPIAESQATTTEVSGQSTRRQPMVYRTGRNVTFSAKATREMVDRFYAIAEGQGWKANETFERAIAALEEAIKQNRI
jgi:hypothetical protein